MAFYVKMFDARRVAFTQSNGLPREDLDLNGIAIFIAENTPGVDLPDAPASNYYGLDHIGLRVDDIDAAVAELKRRGADIIKGPVTIRPGVRIAFVQGPDNVRIELLQRDGFEISEAMGR